MDIEGLWGRGLSAAQPDHVASVDEKQEGSFATANGLAGVHRMEHKGGEEKHDGEVHALDALGLDGMDKRGEAEDG